MIIKRTNSGILQRWIEHSWFPAFNRLGNTVLDYNTPLGIDTLESPYYQVIKGHNRGGYNSVIVDKLPLLCNNEVNFCNKDYHRERDKLVSVVVITYNSSKYVIETLESIKQQEYQNIELIVSDDCSTDNTFELCRKWIENNSSRFTRAVVVRTRENGGICVNYNRGLEEVSGEWVKYIAGDDILMPYCISAFVDETIRRTDKIIICGTIHFSEYNVEGTPKILPSEFGTKNAKEQEKYLVVNGTIIEGPTLFLETRTLREMGGFEEQYPFIEDYPLCMKYLSHGFHIGLVNRHLIRYRVYPTSVSRGDSRFASSIFPAIDYYAPKAAFRNRMWAWWYHHKTNAIIRHLKGKARWIGYILRVPDMIQHQKRLAVKKMSILHKT